MFTFMSLLVVSAALFFWLWELNRGAWVTVLALIARLLALVIDRASYFGYFVGVVLVLMGLGNRDLSGFAAALVVLAAARLLGCVLKYYHPVALLQSFIDRLEAKEPKDEV